MMLDALQIILTTSASAVGAPVAGLACTSDTTTKARSRFRLASVVRTTSETSEKPPMATSGPVFSRVGVIWREWSRAIAICRPNPRSWLLLGTPTHHSLRRHQGHPLNFADE